MRRGALVFLAACSVAPPLAYPTSPPHAQVAIAPAAPAPAPAPLTEELEPASTYLRDVVHISVGTSHVCAVTKTQRVVCWGDNSVGQLGTAMASSLSRPRRVIGLPPITRIAAGHLHSCALGSEGEVFCWGKAGGDVRISEGGIAASMELHGSGLGKVDRIAFGADRATFIALSNRDDMACAVFLNDVRCWSTLDAAKVTVTPLHGVSSVAVEHGDVCAITGDQLWCWRNGTPPALVPRARAAQIAIGEQSACVSGTGGDLACWNSLIGDFWKKPPPVEVKWPKKVPTVAVAVGDSPVCTIDRDGRVDCFLAEETGLTDQALARSWATRKMAPHPIAGIDNARDLGLGAGRDAFGYGFGCAMRKEPDADGAQVFCWGDNESGQLGTGNTAPSVETAVRVLGAR